MVARANQWQPMVNNDGLSNSKTFYLTKLAVTPQNMLQTSNSAILTVTPQNEAYMFQTSSFLTVTPQNEAYMFQTSSF